MSDIAIRVKGLSKRYRLGDRADRCYTLRDSLSRLGGKITSALSGNGRKAAEEAFIWALKDVTFEVSGGDVIGIIGRNGAGKTTLLKILSRITEPTEGRAELHGRVASLLAVGTGFHPELTGRENIYLNGSILGMRRAEIDRKFDEIVAFAGIERFIDTPVKYYSSGMYVRLAFAVAAHLESEILIVDEVLAVGDADFQKKCLGKMSKVAREGRTILFVSHNMAAIQRLCHRGIVLRNGAVAMDGSVEEAIEEYTAAPMKYVGERIWPEAAEAPGNDVVRLVAARLRDRGGQVRSQFDVRDQVTVEIEYLVLTEGHQLCAAIDFQDAMGQFLFAAFDDYIKGPWGKQPACRVGFFRSTCILPGDFLSEGDLSIHLRIFSPPSRPNDNPHIRELEVLRFSATDSRDLGGVRGHFPYEWVGPALRPRLRWLKEYSPLKEMR